MPGDIELLFHFCYGDSNHKHVVEPTDMADMVAMANRLTDGIKRPIQLIHMPVPRDRSDDAYFAPLKDLRLKPATAACASGLVHHTDGVAGTRKRLAAAEKLVKDFSIATECGFGRRRPETIAELLRIHAEVARMSAGVAIRPLRLDERADWEPLWKGYLDFYKTSVPKEVYDTTWARLHDPAEPMWLLGATVDGKLLGIVHYLYHRSCWTVGDYCYLQDLFVAESARKLGLGRALIEAVYRQAQGGRRQPGLLEHARDQRDRARALRHAGRSAGVHPVPQGILTSACATGPMPGRCGQQQARGQGRARMSVTRRELLAGAAAAFAGSLASAQEANWPQRPLRIIIPTAPGGSPDITSRLLGEKISGRLGQSIVVESHDRWRRRRGACDGGQVGARRLPRWRCSPEASRRRPRC